MKNHASGEEKILFLNSEQEKDKTLYTDQVGLLILLIKAPFIVIALLRKLVGTL